MFRALRRRFGIAAPRVAVRTHLPWYWRWFGASVFALILVVIAAWTYDFGMRFAGFEQGQADQKLARLIEQQKQLQQDNAKLHAEVTAGDRRAQIQSASHNDLLRQVKALTEENATLKE